MNCLRQFFSLYLIIFASISIVQSQDDHMFIFGHSLIDHRPPAIATPSDETTVPHWIYLLTKEAGRGYAVGGQYGFLPQHANLPPIAQWGYDSVPGVWESDTEPFSSADISTILITAGNFVQWQAPTADYPSDPGISPISATRDIIDWVTQQESGVRFYIYENWPDMAAYLTNGFPPTPTEMQAYHTYTKGAFHDWWIEYHDSLLTSHSDLQVRMIPVGPIVGDIIETYLANVPITELYEDDAPHGRASLYFLASVVTYMAIYEELAPASYSIPLIVHQAIRDNYVEIINFTWEALDNFRTLYGTSRVFFDDSMTSSDMVLDQMGISFYPNPSPGLFHINGELSTYQIQIINAEGILHQDLSTSASSVSIDISELPEGLYFLRIFNPDHSALHTETIIKSN